MIVKPCQICSAPVVVRYPSRYERTKTCSPPCRQKYAALAQGRYQHELARRRRSVPFEQPKDHKVVPLTQGAFSQVSNEDFHAAMTKHWCMSDTGYARRTHKGSNERLHRFIMQRVLHRDLNEDEQVDHINGDRLDNRRSNLRVVTNQHNAYNRGRQRNNSIGYKGVHRDNSKAERYGFEIMFGGVRLRWGGYTTKQEAAWMYDQFAIELHGDYARPNFVYK